MQLADISFPAGGFDHKTLGFSCEELNEGDSKTSENSFPCHVIMFLCRLGEID